LVVVLLILAAIAGLVIPNVAMLGRTTDMAASAKSQSDLANNMQLFFTLQKRYAQGLDSLLVDDGATGTPTAVYLPQDLDGDGLQDVGLPDSNPHLDDSLTMGTIAGGSLHARSLTRSGFDWVYDHDTTVVNSNESAVNLRDISDRSVDILVAEVITNDGSGTQSDAQLGLARRLFPATDGVMPTGSRLVAFGIGPRNTMIPKTMINSPIYPGNDGSYYGRYVAVFQVYDTGERATLAGVVDSYGRAPDYTQQQFNQSLPNDARRG
ncbi:MAG: hypothetical protein MI861_10815, partial [Pirellulales bacterium]|nr:hypothetical protein [Pirellulales bacterium]